jgi:hypothetical protein
MSLPPTPKKPRLSVTRLVTHPVKEARRFRQADRDYQAAAQTHLRALRLEAVRLNVEATRINAEAQAIEAQNQVRRAELADKHRR